MLFPVRGTGNLSKKELEALIHMLCHFDNLTVILTIFRSLGIEVPFENDSTLPASLKAFVTKLLATRRESKSETDIDVGL